MTLQNCRFLITGSTSTLAILLILNLFNLSKLHSQNAESEEFSFIVTSDMQGNSRLGYGAENYFYGACLAVDKTGRGDFMITTGDMASAESAYEVISHAFGEDYPWYPAVGNHDAEQNMDWLREYNRDGNSLPGIVRPGPVNGEETTYSFDHKGVHFIVINMYYDGISDKTQSVNVVDELYNWLKTDLEANQLDKVLVFGHSPFLPAPDFDNGRIGASTYSVNTRSENTHRFVQLLKDFQVDAYFCGHSHCASAIYVNGVWQVSVGHTQGERDRGTRSTFLRVRMSADSPRIEFWRRVDTSDEYLLARTVSLDDLRIDAISHDRDQASFSFDITAAPRGFVGGEYSGTEYFDGALQALNNIGAGDFMISIGPFAPAVEETFREVRNELGESYDWYPVVAKLDMDSTGAQQWISSYIADSLTVDSGPESSLNTIYSVNYNSIHLVVLNEFFRDNSPTGAQVPVISDQLYSWLESDLSSNDSRKTFVFGYSPMLPAQDMDNGRARQQLDGLNTNSDQIHSLRVLFAEHGVDGYFCSQTRNASIVNLNGIWQIDIGHASGAGDPNAPSTFVKVLVYEDTPVVEFWRAGEGGYSLVSSWPLIEMPETFEPKIAVSEDTVKIGNVAVGRQLSGRFSLMNLGNDELNISDIAVDNQAFTIEGLSASLEPGGGVPVEVIFQSSISGLVEGTVTVESSDINNPQISFPITANVLELGAKVPGALKFTFRAEGDVKYSSPAVDINGNVVFGSVDKNLYVVSAEGNLISKYQTGGYVESSPVIGSDGTIYFCSYDKFVYALDPGSNTIKWSFETGDKIYSSPALAEPIIYVGSNDDYLYAINTRSGELTWKFKADSNIKSSPVIGQDGQIFFCSEEGFVYSLEPDSTLRWEYNIGSKVVASPAIGQDGTLYLGAYDNYLHAISSDGNPVWSFQSDSRIESPAVIDEDGSILFGTNGGSLFKISSDGVLQWQYIVGKYIKGAPLVNKRGDVFFGSQDKYFYSLSSSGQLNWRFFAEEWVYSSPALTDDGILYFGSRDYNLYAVYSGYDEGLAESSWPKFNGDNRNTGSLIVGQSPICDFSGDGQANISDVIALLLHQRANPGDLSTDFNSDGSANVSDAIALLVVMRDGTCPDVAVSLAGVQDDYLMVGPLEGITQNDITFLEDILSQLQLTSEEEAAYRLALYGRTAGSVLPKAFSLSQNMPNPFNPSTTINYSVAEGQNVHVKLKVYNLRGKLVNTLVNEVKEPGVYNIYWNGMDESGQHVSSGVYFYRIRAGNFSQTRKMVLLK